MLGAYCGFRPALSTERRSAAGQAHGEPRAPADLAPDLDIASEQASVLESDREAQPTSGTGPGGVPLVEAVEDVDEPVRSDSRALVAHLDEAAQAVLSHPDRDVSAPVLEGVADQIGRDPLEPPVIREEHDLVSRDLDTIVPAARAHRRPDERPDVHPLFAPPRLSGVEPGDLHQVLDEIAEAGDVVHEELRGAANLGRHAVELLAQKRR